MLQITDKVTFLVGTEETIDQMSALPALKPFDDSVLDFLNDVSRTIMKNSKSKAYSDVVTFGFWLRKSSTLRLKKFHEKLDGNIHLGRGVVFHIAPSNVPVNFAYSLVTGLLTGNSNIVRVPSKEFEQIDIITEAFNKVLKVKPEIKPYIALVRYGRDKGVNDAFSAMADTRIIWGGDATIEEIRKSSLPPRSTEITFADRYSLAVIDSDEYMDVKDKVAVALDFYNDTYFTDQNACTSPRIVVWIGSKKGEAKKLFWNELHKVVEKKYPFQSIQGVNKLTSSYLVAVNEKGTKIINHSDNLIVRIQVTHLTEQLMSLKDNCGYFFEYDCDDVSELKPLCDDKRCQTIAFLGDTEWIKPLLISGVRGVDRVVSIGKTLDFDLIWDGYDLTSQLTRVITI
ncbi:MAG: hypothetical protein J6I76_18240 [Oribacterium sp.]|nr:hypothetical protein [Oribacterium sp.]